MMHATRLLRLVVAVGGLLLLASLLTGTVRPALAGPQPLALSGVTVQTVGTASRLHLHGDGLDPAFKAVLVQSPWSVEQRSNHLLAGETIRSMAFAGRLLLLAMGDSRLAVVERQDAGSWQILGSLDLQTPINDIVLWGKYAVVALARNQGIALVDFSRPEQPTLERSIRVDGFVQSMRVVADQLYFTDFDRGLAVLALDRPDATPTLLGEAVNAWRLAVQGRKMAVGTSDGRLQFYERPANGDPWLLATIEMPAQVRDLVLHRSELLVATFNGLLFRWDLTDWPKLPPPRRLQLPGEPIRLAVDEASGDLLVSLVSAGLLRVVMHADGGMEKIGQLYWPTNFQRLQIDDGLLYAGGANGLELFALADLAQSSPPSGEMLSAEAQRLVHWQGRAYGYRQQALHALDPVGTVRPAQQSGRSAWLVQVEEKRIDFFQPGAEKVLRPFASMTLPGRVTGAVLDDARLYTLGDGGLQIFSVADPRQPRLLGGLTLSGLPQRLAVGPRGTVLVANHGEGLLVLDVRNPAHPVLIAKHRPVRHHEKYALANDLLLLGSLVYIAQGLAGVDLLDLTDPSAPRVICRIDTPGYANSLTRVGDLLLVGDSLAGGFMIDITDPAAPQPIGSVALPTRPRQVLAAADRLLVANSHGVYAMPLPRMLPKLRMVGRDRATIDLPDRIAGETQELTLYAADGRTASAPLR
ncbi:MAG: hypothetical protein RQ723_05105 [Desulfuromonadales bacterium]|nr:hypothetical protein [Desulfuromonadales bacterium]